MFKVVIPSKFSMRAQDRKVSFPAQTESSIVQLSNISCIQFGDILRLKKHVSASYQCSVNEDIENLNNTGTKHHTPAQTQPNNLFHTYFISEKKINNLKT